MQNSSLRFFGMKHAAMLQGTNHVFYQFKINHVDLGLGIAASGIATILVLMTKTMWSP